MLLLYDASRCDDLRQNNLRSDDLGDDDLGDDDCWGNELQRCDSHPLPDYGREVGVVCRSYIRQQEYHS